MKPNLFLLEIIPEPRNDKLIKETLKSISNTIELSRELNKVKKINKLNEGLEKIDQAKNAIVNETNNFIDSVLKNKAKLLEDTSLLET